jgi:hypothetical protein
LHTSEDVFLHRFDLSAVPVAAWNLDELETLATSLDDSLRSDRELAIEPGRDADPTVLDALARFDAQQAMQVALIRQLARESRGLDDSCQRQVVVEKAREIADHAWKLQRRKRRITKRR